MRLAPLLLSPCLLAALLTACSGDGDEPPDADGAWTQGADMPLSARTSPQVGWTGSEVLVVGGDSGVPTNPAASGEVTTARFMADGAAYDPASDSWRRIASAPEPIAYYFRSAMVGDVMVVQTVSDDGRTTGWLTYDASDDEWTEVPDPPQPATDHGSIGAGDGYAVALTGRGQPMLLDVEASTWTVLPRTGASRREGRDACVVVGDGSDIYVSGGPTTYRWNGDDWLAIGVQGCWRHWTGTRLLAGFDYYDPATEELGVVPGAPDVENDPAPDHVGVDAADGPLVATYGYVYDERDDTWTALGRPDAPVDLHTGAAWADGRLVVVGGLDADAGYEDTSGLSTGTWIWTPE